MRRKHYKLIAKALAGEYVSNEQEPGFVKALLVLCEAFEDDNNLFERGKFLRACGITWHDEKGWIINRG
jgi:hypothetical protein